MHVMKTHYLKAMALTCLAIVAGQATAGEYIEADFDIGDFSDPLTIDNTYWPLVPLTEIKYFAEEGDECVVSIFAVTNLVKNDFTNDYAGMEARVVYDREYLDEDCDGDTTGELLLEETWDWYAQDDFDFIWYLGEATTAYEYDDNGVLIGSDTEGSFEAGVDGAEAGYIMLAEPEKGMTYRQEFYEGEAEDMAKIKATDADVSLEILELDFEGCVVIKEWNPLDSATIEHKYFCPGTGLVLVRELSGGSTVRVEPISGIAD